MEDGKIYGSENRRKMYENLSNDGFELGTFEDFNQNMDNKDTRQAIYRAAQGAGWDLPDYSQFDRDMTVRQMKIGGEMKEVDHATYDDFIKRHPSGSNVMPKNTDSQQPLQQPTPRQPQQQSKPDVSAPKTTEIPESHTLGTPWGSEGGGTGKSAAYKSYAPGQVRETGDPGASQFGVPYKPDTEMTAAERDAVYRQNDYAVKQLGQMEREEKRRSQPVLDTGNKDVNSHVIKTQGEWEDDLQKGVRRISSSVVVPAVDKAIAEFDKKAHELFEEGREKSNSTGGLPTGTAAGAGIFGNIRESNQAKDPDKILNYLRQQMESVYKDGSFVEEIGKEADRMGIDRNEYLEKIIKPQIQSDLASRFESAMISKELPKSGLEYVVNGLSNSIVGMVADTFLKTKSQRAYKNQAEAMTEEGRNPNYSPSTSASLSKIGVTFAADAPFFGVTGRVGGQVAKKFAERQIQNMMAKGLSEGAARSIVGTALENSVGARMKNYLMQHVISSGITMGGFNALSEGARQVRDDEFDPLKLAGSTAEGLATGAAFGLTGGVSQALSQPLSGFAKIGAKAAGFGAEAETMYATEELAKMIQGEEGFTNPFEGSVESLMKLGVMKLSSPGGLVKTIGEIAHPLRSIQAQRTGVNFTKEEEALIRDSAEGKSLLEALSGMHPDKAVSEVNGKKILTPEGEEMRRRLADSYNAFMENPEYPADVKQKVAEVLGGVYKPGLETGADIVQNEDGSVTLKTRDKDGNCIREMKFDSFEDADQWRNEFKTQMERNDAVNMWNNASDETRQKIVDDVRQQISGEKEAAEMLERANGMKQSRMRRELERLNKFNEEHEGRGLTDEEARNYIQTVIRDGSDEVFREMYQTIHDNAYPRDEYNPRRNYEDGRKADPMERHFAQVDLQVKEERLAMIGQDFAEEVTGAADYADEKMAELAMRNDVTKEQLEAARDYYNANARLAGVMDEALKGIDEQVEAANAQIMRNTHPDSGTLIEASHDNKNYYVTAGHFEISPDGRLVSSDGTGVVIVRDRNTGEIEVMNPQDLNVTAVSDPKRLIESNESMEGLRGQLTKQADDTIELHPDTPETPQEMGETFTGADGKVYMVTGEPDESGNVVWMKLEIDGEGNPTGKPQPLDIDEYRKAKSDEIDAADSQGETAFPVEGEHTDTVREVPDNNTDNTVVGPTRDNRSNDDGEGGKEEAPPSPGGGIDTTAGDSQRASVTSKISLDENGRKLYEQATPEDTLADLVEKKGEEKAGQMVDLMVDNLARQIDELSKKDMSKVTDMNDIDAHDTEIADLKKKLDYWNGISQQIKAQKAKKVWENLVNPKEIRNFATDPEGQQRWVDEHIDEIVDSYVRTHGNLLDPDEMRNAFAGMGYNGKNVTEFRKQEGRVVAAIYERMLKEAVANGNTSITLLTGAGGAGKSTATKQMDLSGRGVVYDSAFNKFNKLNKAIEAAKAAGMKDIQVIAVYNDATTSFSNSVDRGLRTGRFMSMDYFVNDAFLKNQGKIAELRQAHPDVEIIAYDNSGNKAAERPEGGRVSVDEAEKWDYTLNDAKLNELLDIFENGINEGRFTEDQIASIGQGLRNVTRSIPDLRVQTEQRVSGLVQRISGQDVPDLRPGVSGEPVRSGRGGLVSAPDGGVQGSSGERPAEGEPGATGQTPTAAPAADGEVRNRAAGTGTDNGGHEPPAAGGSSGSAIPGLHTADTGGTGASATGGTGMVRAAGSPGGASEVRPGGGSGSSGNNAGGAGKLDQGAGEGQPPIDPKNAKKAQKLVEKSFNRTFTYTNPQGNLFVVTVKNIDHNKKALLITQTFDPHGRPINEAHEERHDFLKVAEMIEKGIWKKQLDADEKLRQIHKFDKFRVGDIPIIDVLTDGEKQQILEAYEQGDKEKVGYLTGEFRKSHKEDFILRGRNIRNEKVERALSRSGRGERLRGVREQYKGFPEASVYLEDQSVQPHSIEEYVAEALGDVPKMGNGFLAYTSYDQGGNKIVGLKDETGFGSRGFGGDTKGFNPWLAPSGKGMSLKQFAESIREQLPEGMKQQYSDQDIRNVIHTVMTSAEKPTDIANYILRNRMAQAEAEARHTEEGWMEDPDFQKATNDNSFASRLQRGKQSVNTDPTEGQKEAGNYKKGHISFGGYDFTIENPEGSIRRGESNGKKWEQKMNNTYGYILGKYGKDGDHLDMFINDAKDLDNWNGTVYVVDQVDPKTGKFDEHKILYGFDSLEEAKKAYLSNYEEGWQGLGRITGVTKEGFDQWIDSSKQKIKEFADHSIAKEHMVESDHPGFDSALKQLGTRGISVNDPELMKEYGLKDLTLSKSGDHVTLNKIVVEDKGQGNGTRFMEDLARLADEKGWTLALTPSGGFGAKSIKRLKDFYKRFGFVDNKGRNQDFQTRESMIRRPKDYEAANTPEQQEKILRDAVVDYLRSKGIEVSDDWKLGQKILDDYNSRFSVGEDTEGDIKAQKSDQPNFFRTADGQAYGYTYQGKIYIDPRIATSETPIHEYGHLWAEMKRQTAPEEWGNIKRVMLTDKLVQPVIDRVKRDYPELAKEGREDDFIEEIITQFSGKRGSERLREIADEVARENGGIFGKAEAVTAMQRLKSILNRFWEGVAKMMGWKYTNANQIADRIMADMLNGVNPREEIAKVLEEVKSTEEIKPAKLVYLNAKTVKMPEKQIEDLYSEGLKPEEAINMQDRVLNMSPKELIEQYRRLNSQMLDENGLNIDEQEDAFRQKWFSEHDGIKGFGQASADHFREQTNKYTYNKMALRWDVLDRIKELGLEDYIDKDTDEIPDVKAAEIIRMQKAPKYQLVGKKGAAEADKAEGVTTRQDNMAVAEEMEKAGKDAKAIKFATGWERGKDGQWRYETVDADADVLTPYEKKLEELKSQGIERPVFILSLGKLIGSDNELFKYYPKMKNVNISFDPTMNEGTAGSFDGKNIAINSKHIGRFGERTLDNEDLYGTLLHEIQHAVQEAEGFAKGGSLSTAITKEGLDAILHRKEAERNDVKTRLDAINKILSDENEIKDAAELDGRSVDEERTHLHEQADELAAKYDNLSAQMERISRLHTVSMTDAKDLYRSLAGEVEARNATERMNMTEEERRNKPASETEDVSRDNQVVIMDSPAVAGSFTGSKEEFDKVRNRAVKDKGIVTPGLAKAKIKVVDVPVHDFASDKPIEEAEEWAKKNLVTTKQDLEKGDLPKMKDGTPYTISGNAVSKYLSESAVGKSENPDVHLSVLKKLKDVIGESIDTETRPDYPKDENGERKTDTYNKNALIHILYGAVNIDGTTYRVKTTMQEFRGNETSKPHSYEVTEIELLDSPMAASESPSVNVGQHKADTKESTNNSITGAKLLNNVEKSKDPGKYLLDESKNAEENENNSLKFQRTGSPEPEMTPEERQYWKRWDEDMRKWKERNALPAEATGPGEKPKFRQGESALDFAKRLVAHNREKALWQTAPKLEDYHQKRADKDMLDAAREAEKRYPDSPSARMRRIAAEFQQIRHAISQQKAYDKATVKAVTDFAQEFMRQGFGDHLSRGEMERMLSSVKNATGAKDIRQSVDNIMNILIDNHLRNLDQQVQKLSSTRELSKTAQGVEKQGRLELKGQRMIQAFRKAREGRMDADRLREEISKVAEKMARSDDEAPMWEQDFEGLQIALQYQENIEASRDEYADLDREYREAVSDYKGSGRSYKDQQELLESLDQAMMENKIERIGMFGDIIGRLQGNISESMEGAKKFVEREKERVKHIQQIANFDLAGKPADALREKSKGRPANFFLQPLGTFEQMLRQFGSRNANGEGYLYDYFMRNWMDATDKAFLNEQKAKEELDDKAREVFGGKVKRWSDLYDIARSLPSLEVEVLDGENPKTFKLNQGNLLYIYMADKMTDGRMKLRKMGIDEEKVEKIKDFLDPRLVQLGDWLQDEYLVKKRTEYNKVHERMFGAPMAAIDHYFPLKVLGDARYQEQDVNVPDSETLPSTITGNIIKRRKNALPLDILHTDALSLAIEHVEDMERWAAQAEWNKDINTLLSYTTFRNKVKNMDTVYGSGDALWNAFKDTAKMAAGTYDSSAKSGHVDKTISNIAKGVTAAKINFRAYTAFKQILSAPAFLHDVRIDDFVKNSVNPYGSWKWAMENMPVFRKRWKSRQAGDTRLMDDPTDWKMWKTNIVQMATRLGMSPNALVDGITCAVGARSIYEGRYRKYKEMGASDEVARKRALQDAEIGYNLTQQSSEGAFTSAIQKDRTVAANMLSVFRNSSMSYTRQWYDAYRNLKKRTQKGYKEDSIKFMTRQIQEQFGLDEDQAKRAAELEYAREGRRDVARMLNMMFGVTVAWNLGASLPYLLLGDDDNTKKEMMTDALLKGLMAGPTEGFAAGNIWSDLIGRTLASEETRRTVRNEGWGAGIDAALKQGGDYEVNPLPLMADIQSMIKKLGYDKFAAAQDVFNIGMQSAVGVNPQTFTDMWNAAMDYGAPGWDGQSYSGDNDLSNAKEIALFIMRLMNAPSSSWKNKYIDELGMNAKDAKKLPYDEMAKRYAHYKHWKDAPVMGWLRGEEGRAAKIGKMQQQFDKAVEERMQRLTDDELRHNVARSESAEEKRKYAKLISQRLGLTPGSTSSKPDDKGWYQELYQERMDYEDIREDETLAQKLRDYREKDNRDKTREEVKKRLDWIRDGKYDTDNGRKGKSKNKKYTLLYPGKRQLSDNDGKDAKDIMKNIRRWRKEALEMLLRAEAESK